MLQKQLEEELVDYKEIESEMVVCGACSSEVEGGKAKAVCAIERYWHLECFTCTECEVRPGSGSGFAYVWAWAQAYVKAQ
jgi:hypothetical protein